MYYPGVWVKLEIVVQDKLCFGRSSTVLTRYSDRSFFIHYLSTANEAIVEVIDLEAVDDDIQYPKKKKPLCIIPISSSWVKNSDQSHSINVEATVS